MKTISSAILSMVLIILLVGCEKSSSDYTNKSPTPHTSTDWIEHRVDEDGNVWTYKILKIEKDQRKHFVQLWRRNVYSDKGRENKLQKMKANGIDTTKYNKLFSFHFLEEYDCLQRRVRVLSAVEYDKNHNVISSFDTNDEERKWVTIIVPFSFGDYFLQRVCQ